MNVYIRPEKPSDYKAIFDLIEIAFKEEEFSDHKEQYLVERLRMSNAYIPELSLVALFKDRIVGHILFTRIRISNVYNQSESLALAPVTVLPEFQRKGIGGKLIKEAHEKAKALGYKSSVVLGHESYYPKFGYQRADKFDIYLPFDVPKENCMVAELVEDGLKGVKGTVEYAKEFYE